ncbi:alpha/beta hydrolase-fold protein [Pedobacter antarcticus]|uniref:alpha/beta hydrolase-fold protein n=1 Tax=Pedobacter antarcticus TaxID=34086 RepID=UPI0029314477|nr:alpha/beta hydrolase-fold protein [Pedobacter antarcticus]
MRKNLLKYTFTVIYLFLSTQQAEVFAQTLPSAPVQKNIQSPEVDKFGAVTFRFLAPNAKKVTLIMDDAKPRAMSIDTGGVWSYRETFNPDVYRYSFAVDGNNMPDPNNPYIKPLFKRALGQSLVHVPGPSTLSWEVNDVPHGVLSQHFFRSAIIGDQRDMRVYTPPGYDPNRPEPYPVLYLFHGITDETSAWVTAGRENIIMDNLIAQGKAKPMIIVNTLGYGAPEMFDPGSGVRSKEAYEKNERLFIAATLKEVIPMVEGFYNAGKTKKYRAVAGLSMGGGQSLDIGLNHPDVFDYVGGFSPAVILLDPDYTKAFPKLDESINQKLKLIWIAIGKDDYLTPSVRKYIEWLKTKNISFEYKESEGVHSYQVWRRYLTEFAPLLFK